MAKSKLGLDKKYDPDSFSLDDVLDEIKNLKKKKNKKKKKKKSS